MGKSLSEELYAACAAGESQTVAKLLRAGADASYRDPQSGQSCIHAAVKRHAMPMATLLAKHGADMDARDKHGDTVLHYVCRRKHPSSMNIAILLDAGADPNVARLDMQGRRCETPLHYACAGGAMLEIKRLLEAGADPLAVDESTGQKPYDCISTLLKGVQRVMHPFLNLPRVDFSRDFTRQDLLQSDTENATALDNPVTWRAWERINTHLATHGESLDKEDLLRIGKLGKPHLQTLIEGGMLKPLAASIRRQGGMLEVADFTGHPELTKLLENRDVLRQIFNVDNLAKDGIEGFNRNIKALPDGAREKLTNYFSLKTELQVLERARDVKQAGRRSMSL